MNIQGQSQPVPKQAITEQLARILQSSLFVASARLCRFLRFTIESVVEGATDTLKESVVGNKVYDRSPTYDARQDSIVRTEARRLRCKLKEYYETVGRADPVFISYRPGTYAPSFHWHGHAPASGQNHPFREPSEEPPRPKDAGVTIAVLPFDNGSGDTFAAECARDLTDDLTHLCMITAGIRVVGRVGFLLRNEPPIDTPSAAQKPNVQAVYTGTVRGEGKHLRVSCRLVKADGYQIWSQRFDVSANPHSRFALAEQLASAIVSRTLPQIAEIQEENASGTAAPPGNYQAFLTAQALLDEGTVPALLTALAGCKEIAAGVPRHPRPVCEIAKCHCQLALGGVRESAATVTRAREAALHALALDPGSIPARVNLAWAAALAWDWSTAETCFQDAPGAGAPASGYRVHALYAMISKNFEKASYYLQKAQQMDAFSNLQRVSSAMFFHFASRGEEALAYFDGPLRFEPVSIEAQLYLALSYLQLGQPGQAKRLAERSRGQTASQPQLAAFTAELFALCGDRDQAMQMARQSKLFSPASPISHFRQALLSLALGEPAVALTLLTRAAEEKEAELIWLAVEPRFAEVRDDPRFIDLVHAIHARASFFKDAQTNNRCVAQGAASNGRAATLSKEVMSLPRPDSGKAHH